MMTPRFAVMLSMLMGFVSVASIGGCRTAPPPRDWPGHEAAMSVLAEERSNLEAFAGACAIRLRDADGSGTTLDGAMAARGATNLRLRAWKFGRAVFDLTSTVEGIWIMPGDDPEFAALLRGTAQGFGDAWSLLSGAFFDDPALMERPSESAGDHTVERARDDGTVLRGVIDRESVTPRRFELVDSGGAILARLELDRYREIDSMRWPMRLSFTSDRGSIEITFREIEINPDLPPAAFRPPARAVRAP